MTDMESERRRNPEKNEDLLPFLLACIVCVCVRVGCMYTCVCVSCVYCCAVGVHRGSSKRRSKYVDQTVPWEANEAHGNRKWKNILGIPPP